MRRRRPTPAIKVGENGNDNPDACFHAREDQTCAAGGPAAPPGNDGRGVGAREAIRKERLDGLHFRKQHPIHRFILDFFCAKLNLCVEVDGAIHAEQRQRDEERTAHLAARGIAVLRFTNDEVLHDIEGVLTRIRAEACRLAPTPEPER